MTNLLHASMLLHLISEQHSDGLPHPSGSERLLENLHVAITCVFCTGGQISIISMFSEAGEGLSSTGQWQPVRRRLYFHYSLCEKLQKLSKQNWRKDRSCSLTSSQRSKCLSGASFASPIWNQCWICSKPILATFLFTLHDACICSCVITLTYFFHIFWPPHYSCLFFNSSLFSTRLCPYSGRESRLPLTIMGEAVGPKLQPNFNVMDMKSVFVGAKSCYEVRKVKSISVVPLYKTIRLVWWVCSMCTQVTMKPVDFIVSLSLIVSRFTPSEPLYVWNVLIRCLGALH